MTPQGIGIDHKGKDGIPIRKRISLMLSLCLLLTTTALGLTEPAAETGVFPAIAGENGTTYVSLFDVIISGKWTPVWQDYIAAALGEDAAPDMTARLQSSITSDLYGEAAVAAFADGIGDIVGSGFFNEELAAQGEPFDQPTVYELVDCTAE